MTQTQNLRVTQIEPLIAPVELHARHPCPPSSARFVADARSQVERVLRGDDQRLLAIVGPCSIHDPAAALEYAGKLKVAAERVADDVLVCMRVYFEKPRTTVGWKGLINDPHLDGRCDVAEGLSRARALMLELAGISVATATETLDPITPQYLADLIT